MIIFPLPSFWEKRRLNISAREVVKSGWYNIYRDFSDARIWPRGFPLESLQESWAHRDREGGVRAVSGKGRLHSARLGERKSRRGCGLSIDSRSTDLFRGQSVGRPGERMLVPIQQPEYHVLSSGLSPSLSADPLLISHDRYLAFVSLHSAAFGRPVPNWFLQKPPSSSAATSTRYCATLKTRFQATSKTSGFGGFSMK